MRMHSDELDIDVDMVRSLLAEQFPDLADLPIRPIRSVGTVNAIYRLGDELSVRLPRLLRWSRDLERERMLLPHLAPHVHLELPTIVENGYPSERFPSIWAIHRWIEGEPYADSVMDGGVGEVAAGDAQDAEGAAGEELAELVAAEDLARFVAELRAAPALEHAPHAGRDPLRELDAATREALSSSDGVVDARPATEVWDAALDAPPWTGPPVWIHADLLRPNVLVHAGRIAAVIDFGGAGVGDPAADVIAAWTLFGPAGRERFRETLGVDDETWTRARAYALTQAAMIVPYYAETNPAFVAQAQRTIEQVVNEASAA